MVKFEEREKGFEAKFLHDQNIEFKINGISKRFKKYLGLEMRIKNIPDLRFIYDKSTDYAEKMNQMIQSIDIPKDNDS